MYSVNAKLRVLIGYFRIRCFFFNLQSFVTRYVVDSLFISYQSKVIACIYDMILTILAHSSITYHWVLTFGFSNSQPN